MTTVIGFNMPNYHDNAVAVIVDGNLVYATEEERFSRHRYSQGELPRHALANAFTYLKKLGIKPEDVDAFALNFDARRFRLSERIATFMSAAPKTIHTKDELVDLMAKSLLGGLDLKEVARRFLRSVYTNAGYTFPEKAEIVPLQHHLTHAATGHYFSGFNSSAVLVIDGVGERETTSLWNVKNGEFESLEMVDVTEGSIGILYEATSTLLGFGHMEGPGKVMGLAPYGRLDASIKKKFDRLLDPNTDKLFKFSSDAFDKRYAEVTFLKSYAPFMQILGKGLDLSWNPREGINKNVANIAWMLQNFTEEKVMEIARKIKEETGSSRIALSGGVALNAKANMELYYSKLFNDIFIFPAANDAGTPIGAAAYVYEHVLGGKMHNRRLDNVYLGNEYSDKMVRDIVKASKLKADYIGNDVGEVARLASKGKIVSWYQGRSELGPRALGNRSIVADPRDMKNWDRVNKIKGREWWRPLAPSLTYETADRYIVDPVHHQFMILMFKVNGYGKKHTPAVCHVDGTTRAQTVKRQENRNWHSVIKAFEEETGESLVVNTSFNLAGEPLVETPKDAIRSFALGGFDAMYLQGWLLTKR